MQIIFEGGLIKKIGCSADGSSLVIQDSPMIESDLGEYGKQLIKDISDISVFDDVIGEKLQDLEVINSETEQGIIGLRFQCSNSKSIDILTLGDVVPFYKSTPLIIIEESITFQSLSES